MVYCRKEIPGGYESRKSFTQKREINIAKT